MDLIQELKNLKSTVAGMASSEVMLPTLPPQHPFAAGISVERVVGEIDQMIMKLTSIKEGEGNNSTAAHRLRNFVANSHLSSQDITELLEIANVMDNELNIELQIDTLDNDTDLTYPETLVIAAKEYVNSYVEANGPCTKAFILGLMKYLNALSDYFNQKKQTNKSPKDQNLVQAFDNFGSKLLNRILRHT
jgi:hypothetical protein